MKKLLSIVPLCLFLLFPLGCRAGDHDFKQVVQGIEAKYHVRSTGVPMLGFVSFFVRATSFGGYKGLRVAEFGNMKRPLEPDELQKVIESSLGGEWSLFVREHNPERSEQSLVYAKPGGSSLRMIIADYDHGELDIVGMELSPKQVGGWLHSPLRSSHRGNTLPESAEGD